MTAPVTGLDHVLVGVRDLEAARRAYELLGFTVSPRGRHVGWGTANYCVMFAETYIELLGIVDPTQFTNNLDVFLERREGLLGIAFATEDAAAAAQALCARGIEAEPPVDLKRKLELPQGEVEPAFKLVHLPPASTPGAPAFLCQHLSRELVWRQPWTRHANGARGIRSVTGVIADPGEAALAYGALFGDEAVWAYPDAIEVETGGGRLRFTLTETLARLYPGVADLGTHAPPWLAGLRIAVADVAATAAHFDWAGVHYTRDSDRLLRLPAAAGCGVVIEFVGR